MNMFKKSQILPHFPYVELTLKDGRLVDTCKALQYRDARLYHVSDKAPDGTQIMDKPQWFFDFKHAKGQTQTIEILQEQAEELCEACAVKIETFEDGTFWF